MAYLTAEQRKELHIKCSKVRIAYPHVFEPARNAQSGAMEYSTQVRFYKNKPEDMAQVEHIRKAMDNAARWAWGPDAEKRIKQAKNGGNTTCFLREDDDYFFINVKANPDRTTPRVVDRDKTRTLKPEDGRIYSGVTANVIFDLYARGGVNKSGINIPYGWSGTLLGVQFVEATDAFAGVSATARDDDFDDLADDGFDDDDLI